MLPVQDGRGLFRIVRGMLEVLRTELGNCESWRTSHQFFDRRVWMIWHSMWDHALSLINAMHSTLMLMRPPTTQTRLWQNLSSEEEEIRSYDEDGPSYDSNTPLRKKVETLVPKPLSALTVYPSNTSVKLVPRVLLTKSQVKINLYYIYYKHKKHGSAPGKTQPLMPGDSFYMSKSSSIVQADQSLEGQSKHNRSCQPTGKKFALGELCPLTRLPVTCCTDHPLVYSVSGCSKLDLEDLGMAPVRIRLWPSLYDDPVLNSGLAPHRLSLPTPFIPTTEKDLEILFQPMFDEYFEQSTDSEPVPMATVVNAPIVSTNTYVSTTIAQDAPSISHSLSSFNEHPPVFSSRWMQLGPNYRRHLNYSSDLHPSVTLVQENLILHSQHREIVSLAEPNKGTSTNRIISEIGPRITLLIYRWYPSRSVPQKTVAFDALWLLLQDRYSQSPKPKEL
ncbi:hypothetical protein Tco_0172902 [Tanacetum coccineum]